MFRENHNLEGQLEYRISRGTNTIEFLKANFDGADLRETVYVTANPQFYRNRQEIDVDIHKVENIWRENWDDEKKTVLPGDTTKHAKKASKEYPNKRLIVHYIQPHYPFITSDEDRELFSGDQAFLKPDKPGCWQQVMTGELEVTKETIWKAYTETLNRALPHAEELLNHLTGKTVVTADHGNMVGERARPFPIREWGHPSGIYTRELVKVPWFVHESGKRKEIYAEELESDTVEMNEEVVTKRLKELGYMER